MKKYISILAVLLVLVAGDSCKKDKHQPPAETLTKFPTPTWKEDQTGKYPVSMTAVLALPENLRAALQQGDKMGAFINDECRGLGTIVRINGALSVFYILIHGTASEQGKIGFKYYSQNTSYMFFTPGFLDFNVDGNYGTPDAPKVPDLTQSK